MGERLLWAVKNGDLTAAKEVVEKVIESSPPRVHPGRVCTAVNSFDIKLTLPQDKEK